MTDPLDLARQLVRIPSVNPMGRSADSDDCYESRLTDFLARVFAEHRIPTERHIVQPGRDNLLARVEGDSRVVVLEAHQDTVPVDGMTVAPFAADVRDGRLWGRGACDVKGPMASMLTAFCHLAQQRPAGMPTVVMACTVDEEFGSTGPSALVELWDRGRSKLLPQPPDQIVVAEPTSLDVVVAHKGTVRWQCHVRGKAAHSSQPQLGQNAIYRMAQVVTALEAYADGELLERNAHARLGTATLSVGKIAGGVSVNVVPETCTIEIDRRLLPNEEPLDAWQHAADFLRQHLGQPTWLEHQPPYLMARGLPDAENTSLARQLSSAIQMQGRPGREIGVPFGTNAAVYAAAGVPAVVFGPGAIDQAHTADEWIEVEQLELASRILVDFLISPAVREHASASAP